MSTRGNQNHRLWAGDKESPAFFVPSIPKGGFAMLDMRPKERRQHRDSRLGDDQG